MKKAISVSAHYYIIIIIITIIVIITIIKTGLGKTYRSRVEKRRNKRQANLVPRGVPPGRKSLRDEFDNSPLGVKKSCKQMIYTKNYIRR